MREEVEWARGRTWAAHVMPSSESWALEPSGDPSCWRGHCCTWCEAGDTACEARATACEACDTACEACAASPRSGGASDPWRLEAKASPPDRCVEKASPAKAEAEAPATSGPETRCRAACASSEPETRWRSPRTASWRCNARPGRDAASPRSSETGTSDRAAAGPPSPPWWPDENGHSREPCPPCLDAPPCLAETAGTEAPPRLDETVDTWCEAGDTACEARATACEACDGSPRSAWGEEPTRSGGFKLSPVAPAPSAGERGPISLPRCGLPTPLPSPPSRERTASWR